MNSNGRTSEFSICLALDPKTTQATHAIRETLPLSPYRDVATSKLIIEEAGGKATNVFGDDQRYDQPVKGMIVSNGLIHDTLIDLAAQYRM